MASADQGAAPGDPPYPPAGRVGYAMGVLVAGWVMAYLDRYVLGILVEPMRHDMALSDTHLSLIQGFAFSLFFVLAGLPLGRLVDRTNRRNILVFGILCWSLATVACGLSHNFWQLFASRLCVGIGEACLAPASFSLVADMIRPRRRGVAMGLLVGGTGVGASASTFLAGLILQYFQPLGGATLPIVGHMQPWQMVLLILAMPGFLVAVLMLGIREPARRERAKTGDGKALTPYLKRHKAAFSLTIGALVGSYFINSSFNIWIPALLMRVHHMPPAEVGAVLGAILISVAAIAPPVSGAIGDWAARRFPRFGRIGPLLLIYPAMAAVHITWWFLPGKLAAIVAFTLSAPLLGNLINGAAYPALNQMAPNEMRGQVTTIFVLACNVLGLGVGPTLTALFTDHIFHDPMMLRQAIILTAVPVATVGFVCAILALKPYRAACEDAAAMIAEPAAQS